MVPDIVVDCRHARDLQGCFATVSERKLSLFSTWQLSEVACDAGAKFLLRTIAWPLRRRFKVDYNVSLAMYREPWSGAKFSIASNDHTFQSVVRYAARLSSQKTNAGASDLQFVLSTLQVRRPAQPSRSRQAVTLNEVLSPL